MWPKHVASILYVYENLRYSETLCLLVGFVTLSNQLIESSWIISNSFSHIYMKARLHKFLENLTSSPCVWHQICYMKHVAY